LDTGSAPATDTGGYVTSLRKENCDFEMDIELEKKIELLEWRRDNALRMSCQLVAKKFQRQIDILAKESRNKSMDMPKTQGNEYCHSNEDNQQV